MNVVHEGRFRVLPSQSRAAAEPAAGREAGLRRGAAGPDVVLAMALPGIWEKFGPRFLGEGWLSFTFISPVYDDEQVREVTEDATEDVVAIRVETRDGHVHAAGHAGMGGHPPWDQEADGTRGADVAFPHWELGRALPLLDLTPDAERQRAIADAARDMAPWFRGPTHWGQALVSPSLVLRVVEDMPTGLVPAEGVVGPGVSSGFDLVCRQMAPLGETYAVSARLVDKGVSGRAWFRTIEFEVSDQGGRTFFVGRHRRRFALTHTN